MTDRIERRASHPNRKTVSAYLDANVVAAIDALVHRGQFPNRSDAIEEACRLLVRERARQNNPAAEVAA